jgi:excinuclease ABC subunit A
VPFDDVMPWKVNGERWHLSEKGFPPRRKVRWDRAVLPRLLLLVREVEPNVEVVWDNRAAISLKVPGVQRSWALWTTKQLEGLTCRFLGKKGQFNLSQVDNLGATATLGEQWGGQVVELMFVQDERLQATKLKEVLAESLRGFRDAFRKSDS